jgi:hypothetical protein
MYGMGGMGGRGGMGNGAGIGMGGGSGKRAAMRFAPGSAFAKPFAALLLTRLARCVAERRHGWRHGWGRGLVHGR